MKLNETQINTIDNILQKLGVVYIDYKFEILDHIATEVENLMEATDMSFEIAFESILKKWEPKLKKSTSNTFGYLWEMPEILMQKAKKIYWRKMILLLIASFALKSLLLILKDYVLKAIDGIWYFSVGMLILQLIGYIKIRLSRQKTTFGFLYKQQFLAFLGLYFVLLIILGTNEVTFENPTDIKFPIFFMIANLSLAPIAIFKFYNEHFEQLKQNKKLV